MNEQTQTNHPIKAEIQTLITQTLKHLREAGPVGRNPLESALETYRQRLQLLASEQLQLIRAELMHHIMREDDLSTRFVLKLMHDVTEAVPQGRRPAYLMPVGVI
ncbi:MAG: hypothetical protein CVV27_18100 [Candidatus Melainabacteria bacterium HGW-Melainabacteria-1]|nr:MAG: hypothetical protein CVV27_18100 [Candidatus Melainabacteria bacterium HGW-Melainabacteria-1]